MQPIDRNQEFYRIQRLPRYVFAEVNTIKAAARGAGHDIIDFGMGNPNNPAPQYIVDKLIEAVTPGFVGYGEILVPNSLVENRHRIGQAARTVKRLLWASPDIHRGEEIQVVAGQ